MKVIMGAAALVQAGKPQVARVAQIAGATAAPATLPQEDPTPRRQDAKSPDSGSAKAPLRVKPRQVAGQRKSWHDGPEIRPGLKPQPSQKERLQRGPRNHRPGLLRFTAVLHLAVRMLLLSSLALLPLAFLSHAVQGYWPLLLPGLLAGTWIAWFICAQKVGCRVCAMRMFRNKPCRKSPKAPNWPLFGPHTTMAVRALYAPSVRCPYCGTPNQLDCGAGPRRR